jgi:hypothetical protein
MNPEDFNSYCGSVDLTLANYSGGAGGTFTDGLNGAGYWTVNGATPTFSTKSGTGWSLEGMDFTNNSSEIVVGDCPMLWEGSIVIIGQISGSAFYIGGNYTSGNSWGIQHTSSRVQFFNALNSSGFTDAAFFNSNEPNVIAASWCPESGTTYAQANDSPVVSSVNATNKEFARSVWPQVGIGQHRTTYLTGWVARVLFFSRALHERDNSNFQLLIQEQMSDIGLP